MVDRDLQSYLHFRQCKGRGGTRTGLRPARRPHNAVAAGPCACSFPSALRSIMAAADGIIPRACSNSSGALGCCSSAPAALIGRSLPSASSTEPNQPSVLSPASISCGRHPPPQHSPKSVVPGWTVLRSPLWKARCSGGTRASPRIRPTVPATYWPRASTEFVTAGWPSSRGWNTAS